MINNNCGISDGFVYPVGEAPAQTLPQDVIRQKIMPKLSIEDCVAMAKVCKQWNTAVAKPVQVGTVEGTKESMSALDQKLLEESVFGKRKWEQIPGIFDVGVEPVLTLDQIMGLVAKLKEPCGFFNEKDEIQQHRFQNDKVKRVWQTQIILLFPESINTEKRTVGLTGHVFRFEKEGNHDEVFEYAYGGKSAAYRTTGVRPSYFAFVTKDVVPGSRATTQVQKRDLVGRIGYRMPETVNEASTLVLFLNRDFDPSIEDNNYFFGRKGRFITYTATEEISQGYPLVVGAAGRPGPEVRNSGDGRSNVGVAAVQEVLSVLGHRNLGL